MFPTPPANAHPSTQLLQVERDGNPLRRFGHVSPFIGKLAPVGAHQLDEIGQLMRAALPDLPEPTLVIGMTESSLLLAFFMARWQQKPVDLRFTSRKIRGGDAHRLAFREPHSHGPQHYLALESGQKYAQIVVIEDELTTGATLRNLILALEGVSDRVFVATLRDLRPQNLRDDLENEFRARGVELQTLSLETRGDDLAAQIAPVRPLFNPFGRDEFDRQKALSELEKIAGDFAPDTVWMLGECVDIALGWWLQLPENARPNLRQITRSPWKIDGDSVFNVHSLKAPHQASSYFIYNFEPSQSQRALWIAEKSNAAVGVLASEFFAKHGIETRGIEVAGT